MRRSHVGQTASCAILIGLAPLLFGQGPAFLGTGYTDPSVIRVAPGQITTPIQELGVCGKMKLRWLLLAYALANVVLYSILLPLWEGFDEPFHFGYVQGLANGDRFPDPRTSRLSQEVGSSFLLTPVSLAVQQNLPTLVSYPEFFSWPECRRQQARQKLKSIDPNLRWKPSDFVNYEGLQAPLAYSVLAMPERITAKLPLPIRVLMLRIMAGTLGAVLLFLAAIRLVSQLEIPSPHGEVAIFCAFSSQMIWATLAHIANDWLAIPLTLWLLVTTIDCAASFGSRQPPRTVCRSIPQKECRSDLRQTNQIRP
jgi:hypothetical protein